MGEAPKERAAQVADQCRVVAHLARAIADVHQAKAEIFAAGGLPSLVDYTGKQTAELMEVLGDLLNEMDAVDDGDAWVDPIFEEAQRLWPSTPSDSPAHHEVGIS